MNSTRLIYLLALALLPACASSELELPGVGDDAGVARDASGATDGSVPPDADTIDAMTDSAHEDHPEVGAPGECARDQDCPGDQVCDVDASTCEAATSSCGDGTCDGVETCATCLTDCGCDTNQSCSAGACVCDDTCTPGQTQCAGSDQRLCSSDGNGCAVLEQPTACSSGTCVDGACCDSACGARECGADSCGGSCGTCSVSCDNGYCRRQLIVDWVRTDCDASCQDAFDPTDPYIQVTVGGQPYDKDKGERDRCDNTLTAQGWTVGGVSRTFTYTELRAVRVEVLDQDRLSDDDVCATWSRVDLTAPGTVEITSADGLVTVSLTTRI